MNESSIPLAKSRNLVELSENVGELSENVGELSRNLVELSQILVALSENLSDVSENVGELSENLGELSRNLGELSQIRVALSENLSDVSEKLSELSQILVALSENLVALSENLVALSENLGDVSRNLGERSPILVALCRNLVELSQNAGELSQILVALSQKLVALFQNLLALPVAPARLPRLGDAPSVASEKKLVGSGKSLRGTTHRIRDGAEDGRGPNGSGRCCLPASPKGTESIMTTTEVTSHPVAILDVPKGHQLTINFAKGVCSGISGHPTQFTTPPAAFTALVTDTATYDTAEVAARGGGRVTTAVRNAARKKVLADLPHVRDYVQGLAELLASPADAAALIVLAGLRIRKAGTRNKPPVSAKNGLTSGSAVLDARRVAAVAMYFWQFSLDQKTWTNAPQSLKTKLTVTGLTPGQVYYFRFSAQTRKGPVDFSQIVSLMVH